MLVRAALVSAVTLALAACGAPQKGAASQPTGKAGVEFRLLAAPGADALTVPTWDGKLTMPVEKKIWLTDRDISDVKLAKMPDGAPSINVQLDQTASLVLEDLTLKNRGRRIAVLVDGKIVTAPTIKDTITIGVMTIVGQSPEQTKKIYQHMTGR